jgi:hypothetical protein
VLRLICHVLAERKIILVSADISVFTPVAEAMRALIFPLQWQYAFVPILPAATSYALRAPVPLLAGVHRSALGEIR